MVNVGIHIPVMGAFGMVWCSCMVPFGSHKDPFFVGVCWTYLYNSWILIVFKVDLIRPPNIEATRRLVVRLAETLSRAMAWQTSLLEPRSILSRGVCGLTREQVRGFMAK